MYKHTDVQTYKHTDIYTTLTYMHSCRHTLLRAYIPTNCKPSNPRNYPPTYPLKDRPTYNSTCGLRMYLPTPSYLLNGHVHVHFFTPNCVHCILRTIVGVRQGALLRSVFRLAESDRMYTHILATDMRRVWMCLKCVCVCVCSCVYGEFFDMLSCSQFPFHRCGNSEVSWQWTLLCLADLFVDRFL